VGAELAVDVLDVLADGTRRDAQPPADGRRDQAIGHQVEDGLLAIGDGDHVGPRGGSARDANWLSRR